ncbi:Chaperone required for the assembly of the F1-ATPase [Jannaschia faecimaris]|uniref:Chaperone required for the assembly of the F1-ATPase n=1 Tax=Jannaschia faecimaris TaxID=1244108 RepID=A0A1H3TTF4_9RHOB|nr:ATP12 family protein [Jannaschia faecimaris]SDZ52995.1 Chaperone required for the assembly of the F1-ATPase [Jannaschia faecimaris]
MSEWKAKRFWTQATVETLEQGYGVRLDGRPVRTPLKTVIAMPTRALAEGVAAEWDAQEQVINPMIMPLTRAVNATLDKVVPQQAEVAANLAEYGGTDLLCYRAAGPVALLERQVAAWDPMLDWADANLGARLNVTQGVMHVAQPANALEALRARVHAKTPWELTALSEFVTLTGSLILGLAAMDGHHPDDLWPLSRIDEDWQAEQWGADEEEAGRIGLKRGAFTQAHRYLMLLRGD